MRHCGTRRPPCRRASAYSRTAARDGGIAPSPRARRVRRLSRPPRRPGPRASVDHRPVDRPAAARQRGRHAVGRLQRRDLQLRRAADRARGARPPLPDPKRYRSDRPRLRGSGATTAFRRFNGQWAIALWDEPTGTLVLARDPFGVRPLYVCEHGGRLYFAQRGEGDLRRRRDAIPRAFDPRGTRRRSSRSGPRCRRRRCSPASTSCRRDASASIADGKVEDSMGLRTGLSRR